PNNPSRAQKYPLDKDLYAQRHLIECCFSKLKHFRRVATRFEKPLETTWRSSQSPLSSYGSDKCPHDLADIGRSMDNAPCSPNVASAMLATESGKLRELISQFNFVEEARREEEQ
ncbi:MAG: family insertion sequence transposase protein, partial [Rhizobium sp.]|nr:family insertion sequence transposase protein [Rhizobium sp.]